MNRFGVCAAVRMGGALPLVVAIAMSLGVAHAAGVDPGSTTVTSAGAGEPAPLGDSAQAKTDQTASKPKASTPRTKHPQTLEAISVTGTRIPQPTLTGNAALQVVTNKEIQLEGVVNVDQLLSNVPSAFTTSSSNTDSEDSFSTVGLRGFGANRTLVLINGTRVVPGDPTAFNTGATDVNGTNLNFIPTALVQRVDVLTGGASAIYGSDAVAGVVNFIMKQNFSGFTFDGQWTQSGHGDGTTYSPTLIWGANSADGKGNVTLYAGYTNRDAVSLQARGFSSCPTLPNASGTGRVCFGSTAIPAGNFTSLDRPPDDNTAMVDPNGTRTFVPEDGSLFNFDKYSDLVRPEKRYQFGGFAHRIFNKHFEVYGSAMFMQDQNDDAAAPSPLFFNQFQINCSNPLLSGQERGFLCPNPGQTEANTLIGRRLVELGPRSIDARNTEYRVRLGLKGAISDGWSYDVTAQRSENSVTQDYFNYYSKQRVQQALQATTGSNGNPVCTDPSGGCVPLDLFQYLAITPAQANFIRAVGLEQGTTAEEVATASVNGDLGRYGVSSPFATRGVQFAGGLEYRRDSLDFLPDPGIQSGDTTDEGGAVPAVNGSFNDADAFTEFQIPLIQDRPFVKDLSLDAAYRLSKYRIATRPNELYTHAYKLGVRYAPDDDVALRASWNRSVRVPDIQELFFPDTVTAVISGDPCSGTSPTGTLAECERTGVTPAQYGNIAQCPALECNVRLGGNLALKPESSITRQLGMVLTPRFFKGFTGTIDYYDIVLTGAIGAIPPLSVLGTCLQTGAFCNLIQRGPTGNLFGDPSQSFISATDLNTGFMRARGFDLSLQYDRYLSDLGLGNNGRVIFNLVGTYVSNFQQKNTPTSPEYDCAGLYGPVCQEPHPRWRHRARLTWENPMGAVPGLAVSLQWRYIGSASLDANRTDNSQLNPTDAPYDAIDAKLSAVNYFDLAATYLLPIQSQDVTLRFGVNNLTSRDPPIATFAALPISTVFATPNNTFASLYDTLGRVFFVGINAHFR
ncbi:MAG: TonB-dependent receptor plug domain-containing protein [Rhodanobacteraceae bacterium]